MGVNPNPPYSWGAIVTKLSGVFFRCNKWLLSAKEQRSEGRFEVPIGMFKKI